MEIKITTSNGVKLNTKGKYCVDNIIVNAQAYDGAVGEGAVNEVDAYLNGSISGKITTYASTIRENGLSCLPNIIGINAPNLTNSNSYSFSKCTSLVNFNAPLLTNVGWGGFDGCSAIKELRLPCLSRATNYSFQNCTSLTDIYSGYDGYISLGNVNSFNGCNTIKLHVKSAYASGYASQTNWSNLISEGKIVIVGDYNAS